MDKHRQAAAVHSDSMQQNARVCVKPAREGRYRGKLQRLAAIVCIDTDLQGVVAAWPEMSEQARHICKVLAGLVED